MFNVAIINKPYNILVALLCLATVSVASCSGGSSRETAEAQGMIDAAKQLIENKQYDSSIVILDSLCKKYPKEIDIVKVAMNLKASTLEKSFTQQLAQADSVIAQNAPAVKEIAGKFRAVKTPEMVEGYRVIKSISGAPLLNRTAIEPRIDDGGNLYIVSLLHGNAIQHTSLKVTVSGIGSESTAVVPYDKARNYRFSDNGISNEMVTFHFDECENFCRFIADNADKNITLTFVGKSTYSMPLSVELKHAIADSFRYSSAIRAGLNAEKAKLLLKKKLEIAQKQVARTKIDEN